MFVTDKIVFLELHKTGGTHIGRLLQSLIGGEHIGKHNRITPELRSHFLIGSVRNPWDWYVSLWAYGCSKRGSVYHQTVSQFNWSYYREQLPREMGRASNKSKTLILQVYNDWLKDRAAWQSTYEDPEDPKQFRKWLGMIMNPKHSLDVREGFGFSPVSRHVGLMSYRYLKLFTSVGSNLYSSSHIDSLEKIQSIVENQYLLDFTIRMESLEEDLIQALKTAGHPLGDDQRTSLLALKDSKTNTSKRQSAEIYFDDESIELVRRRESLIIERHGYAPFRKH